MAGPDPKRNVLFLCGGNSCRSQIGEALLREHASDLFNVHSAGIEPTGEIHPMTREVLAETGLDLEGHTSKGTEEEVRDKFREVRDQIEARILEWVEEQRAGDGS